MKFRMMDTADAAFEQCGNPFLKGDTTEFPRPLAAMRAPKMMFPYLGEKATAKKIEIAIADVLLAGKTRTYDEEGRSSTTDGIGGSCGWTRVNT